MGTVKETCCCGATFEATDNSIVPSTMAFKDAHAACRDAWAQGLPKSYHATVVDLEPLAYETFIGDTNRERLEAARRALIDTGYFTADQVGLDIAPRITELGTRLPTTVHRAHGQTEPLASPDRTTT